ncbi:hypothetical protein K8R43_00800 [archaeon]|nr:hypothetical protein [archaeon]
MKKILLILMFIAGANAYVQMVSPVDMEVQPLDKVLIDPVGPGQEVVLKFERITSNLYSMDSVHLENEIDSDWQTRTSSDSEFLYFHIIVPPNKHAGVHPFLLTISNDEGLERVKGVEVKLAVTQDPADLIDIAGFEEEPNLYAEEQGQAILIVKNKAKSIAKYEIKTTIHGLPKQDSLTIQLQPQETKRLSLPLKLSDERAYTLEANVLSKDNPSVNETSTTHVFVRPTLSSKFKNIGQGFPLIPLTMAPFYAVLGLLGF